MSHKAIRLLIEHTVHEVQDDIQYSYGTGGDFSLDKEGSFVFVNTFPLIAVPGYRSNNGTTNYMKQWNVRMMFAKIDRHQGDREDYHSILDTTDIMVDRFVNKLNFFQSKSDQIVLNGFNQAAFIREINIMTGWMLTFQILANDSFEYCESC